MHSPLPTRTAVAVACFEDYLHRRRSLYPYRLRAGIWALALLLMFSSYLH